MLQLVFTKRNILYQIDRNLDGLSPKTDSVFGLEMARPMKIPLSLSTTFFANLFAILLKMWSTNEREDSLLFTFVCQRDVKVFFSVFFFVRICYETSGATQFLIMYDIWNIRVYLSVWAYPKEQCFDCLFMDQNKHCMKFAKPIDWYSLNLFCFWPTRFRLTLQIGQLNCSRWLPTLSNHSNHFNYDNYINTLFLKVFLMELRVLSVNLLVCTIIICLRLWNCK